MFITIIAKGFMFTEYSYMSSIWYYGDGLLTIIYFIAQLILFSVYPLKRTIKNYLNGFSMLTVVLRALRLIREIKNSTSVTYFRILLYILGKVIKQLVPLLVFSFFVIVFFVILAMNTMDGKVF